MLLEEYILAEIIVCIIQGCYLSVLASMDNELPEDGVSAPKYVGAILMQILILFLTKFTCAFVGK
jgi:hypothetical protein